MPICITVVSPAVASLALLSSSLVSPRFALVSPAGISLPLVSPLVVSPAVASLAMGSPLAGEPSLCSGEPYYDKPRSGEPLTIERLCCEPHGWLM